MIVISLTPHLFNYSLVLFSCLDLLELKFEMLCIVYVKILKYKMELTLSVKKLRFSKFYMCELDSRDAKPT